MPLDVACVIGCAVQTGVGAVINTAGVEPGATVLVTGLGGVGLSIVQGAVVAGASRLIVSDPVADRREAAIGFGATDAIDPNEQDVVAEVQSRTDGIGADYAFEAAGRAALIEVGLQATRSGGTTVVVGVPPLDESLTINPIAMFQTYEKKLVGSLLGSVNARRDIPILVALWQSGRLDLEGLDHRASADRPDQRGLRRPPREPRYPHRARASDLSSGTRAGSCRLSSVHHPSSAVPTRRTDRRTSPPVALAWPTSPTALGHRTARSRRCSPVARRACRQGALHRASTRRCRPCGGTTPHRWAPSRCATVRSTSSRAASSESPRDLHAVLADRTEHDVTCSPGTSGTKKRLNQFRISSRWNVT